MFADDKRCELWNDATGIFLAQYDACSILLNKGTDDQALMVFLIFNLYENAFTS